MGSEFKVECLKPVWMILWEDEAALDRASSLERRMGLAWQIGIMTRYRLKQGTEAHPAQKPGHT